MGIGKTTIITPKTTTIEFILKAKKAITHHDPLMADGSNTRLFRRRPILTSFTSQLNNTSTALTEIYENNPVPSDLASMFCDMDIYEFTASSFVSLFIDSFNSSEGMGHFDNTKKFQALQKRLKQAAVKSFSLRQCWDSLIESMGVDLPPSKTLPRLMPFFKLPKPIAYTVIGHLIKNHSSYVSIAQYWHDKWKLANYGDNYVNNRNEEKEELVKLTPPSHNITNQSIIKLDIPELSENSLRHQLRSAGRDHLFTMLNIMKGESPGWGQLPEMVESLFVNGGNIQSGAKSPSSPHTIAGKIRKSYPIIDLFSGTTKSFWLGQGMLTGLEDYFICKENKPALYGTAIENHPLTDMSVFDMLVEETETRHATERGNGQMIQNFETVIRGAEIYVKCHLSPHISQLTKGAFFCTLLSFLNDMPTVGGMSARGKGFVDGEILSEIKEWDSAINEYETYIKDNYDNLRSGLISGELMTGIVVI